MNLFRVELQCGELINFRRKRSDGLGNPTMQMEGWEERGLEESLGPLKSDSNRSFFLANKTANCLRALMRPSAVEEVILHIKEASVPARTTGSKRLFPSLSSSGKFLWKNDGERVGTQRSPTGFCSLIKTPWNIRGLFRMRMIHLCVWSFAQNFRSLAPTRRDCLEESTQ